MEKLTIKEIKEAVGGLLLAGNETDTITSICTDSRLAEKDGMFIPIIGEVHDAHRFIPQVIEKGCRTLLVSNREAIEGIEGINIIYVKNTIKALQSLAHYYLKKLNLKTVAVTGSVGKTSTRDITYAILSEKYKTGTTVKNYNNDIGVPLTIFSFDSTMEAAVLEIGMDHAGEIHRLVNIIRPDVGIITNVGVSHLENLGSRENIRAAKMEIVDYFDGKNTLVLNRDNDMLETVSEETDYNVLNVGTKPENAYYIHDIEDFGIQGIKFTLTHKKESYIINVPIPGAHNALNATLAIAACNALGVSIEEAISGISKIRLTEKRLAIKEHKGMHIIDDTYNAAPESMKSAINTLMKSDGKRKVAILAGMNELGPKSAEYHYEVGAYAGEQDVDLLIAVGTKAKDIADGAESILSKDKVFYFPTKDEFYHKFGEILKTGDTILVKASRGMEMEQVVDKIMNE